MREQNSGSKGALTVRERTRNDTVSPRSREEEIGQPREWI